MYVCVCHAITDSKVRAAVQRGADSAAKVYQSCGVTPRCGKCLPMMRELVQTAREAMPLQAAE